MTTHRTHPVRMWSALLALVVALMAAGMGVASAATADPGIDLGIVNGPTTTITADGTPIELIPAASAELPAETTAAAASSQIEVQGVSSSTGPTAAAGMAAPVSLTWILVGALVILGGAALLLTRSRRAARH